MDKENQFVSAVVYVHNGADTLPSFLEKVDKAMAHHFTKYEIICVNDASSEDVERAVKSLQCQDESASVTMINMSYYQGLELSMTAGVDMAIGDFVFEFDDAFADFNIEAPFEAYQAALEGYDIVNVASGIKMALTSRLFYSVFNRFANLQYALGTETFRILSRRAINRVRGMSETSPYRKALYANCGLNMRTIKAPIKTTRQNQKGLSGRSQLAIDAIILFTDIGYRFAITMTFLMMLTTAIVALYAVVVYIFQNPVEGWTPTILFLSFAFFGVFGILAVVIKYLSIIVDLIYKKQKYVYESIQKFSKQ